MTSIVAALGGRGRGSAIESSGRSSLVGPTPCDVAGGEEWRGRLRECRGGQSRRGDERMAGDVSARDERGRGRASSAFEIRLPSTSWAPHWAPPWHLMGSAITQDRLGVAHLQPHEVTYCPVTCKDNSAVDQYR